MSNYNMNETAETLEKHETLVSEKEALRYTLKNARNEIPEESRIAQSKALTQILTGTEMYQNARYILSYVSYGSEVDTHDLIKQAIKDQKEVYVPKTMETIQGRRMAFFKCEDLQNLKRNARGILEPEIDYANVFPVDIHMALDRGEQWLVIVPCLAFDEKLGRIGYGGGYYDRFLSKLLKKFAIGLAFKEQIIDHVPMGEKDQPVDLVLTPEKAFF